LFSSLVIKNSIFFITDQINFKDFTAIIKVKIELMIFNIDTFLLALILFCLMVVTNCGSHNWISEAGYDQILWGIKNFKGSNNL